MPQVQVIQPIQQQPKRLRVAAYARVSSDSEDQLNSLSVQVDYYTHLIQENPNWDFAGIYADEGIVSKQMFREVQAEIARRNSKSAANQRKHRRGRYNSKYALSERLVCGNCGSPYKRVTWNIHGRKQIVWRCVNRIEYGTKFCGSSPSVPEEKLHRAILKAVQDLAANFTDEVAAQINGILHDIQTGESTKPNLQEQLEQTQQEFDRLLEMSLDFDENTPFLDDKLKKLNNKIKSLKKAIEDSAARQEKASQPEMLLSAKVLQIQEYDDALTARIIEKITVRSRNEIEIRFIGGYKKTMQLT